MLRGLTSVAVPISLAQLSELQSVPLAASSVHSPTAIAAAIQLYQGTDSPRAVQMRVLWAVTLLHALLTGLTSQQEAPHVNDLEFDGPLDGGRRQSCVLLFVRYTHALTCKVLPPAANWDGPKITAEVCKLAGNETLFSIYTPPDLRAVFHATLEGPQVLLPPISTCTTVHRNDTDKSGQEVITPQAVHRIHIKQQELRPGNYTLVLRLAAHNFTFGTHMAEAPYLAPVVPHVEPLVETYMHPLWQAPLHVEHSEQYMYSPANIASWPVCKNVYLEGTVLSNFTGPIETALESGKNASVWNPTIRWQPKGCNLVPVHEIDVQTCLADRLVCFIGDSHMRHMHNGVSDIANNFGPRVVGEHDLEVYPHTRLRFIWTSWLNHDEIVNEDKYKGCTHVFLNMGAWPLSQDVPARWTSGHYAKKVHEAIHDIRNLLPQAQLYWVTLTSHNWGYFYWRRQCRHPPYMDLFQQVGSYTARLLGVPVMNVWDISAPLSFTTYDLAHHHWSGVAGHHITEYALNILCVQKHHKHGSHAAGFSEAA